MTADVQGVSRWLIVGRGPSLSAFDWALVPEHGCRVVAVNGASTFCPHMTDWITVDSLLLPSRAEAAHKCGARCTAAIPDNYYTHRVKGKLNPPLPAWLNTVRAVRPPSDGPLPRCEGLYNANSGFGAFQFAVQSGATRVALLGFDACLGYFDAMTPHDDYGHLPGLFERFDVGTVLVQNGSPESNIMRYPRCTPNAAARWLTET